MLKVIRDGILSNLSRQRLLAAGTDFIIVFASYYVILAFRFQGSIPESMSVGSHKLNVFLVAAVVVHLVLNAAFHVYSIVNRYVGLVQATWLVKSTVVAIVILLIINVAWPTGNHRLLPLSVVILGGAAAGVVMVAVRFYSRIFQSRSLKPVCDGRRVVLVGAGSAAEILMHHIAQSPSLDISIVGLLDDDPKLRGMRLRHHSVLGTIADAAKVAAEHDVEEFIITIPSADAKQMERIYTQLQAADLPVKTLPPLSDLIDGRVSMADVRGIEIEDLLGRSPVETDLAAIASYLKGRRVLVTGAAGSIGSELCRQIASFAPEKLVLVDRDESGLYALHEELRRRDFLDYTLVTTHIQQRRKMNLIFREYRPHVVFHAAAFKHVPLMESCPDEAVVNNVLGTLVVAEEAAAAGVERFVNISTDKAADPVNIMGASKSVAELVVREVGAEHPEARFCSVRFGNVLGSRGSMLPIFQKQIEKGGPVTVTHKDMTRYFMSISEAVQLVLQAAALSIEADHAGAVFILEMGEPVSILDLAHKMIDFSRDGRSETIRIEFTGLRPGERLHERLVGRLEQNVPTSHPLITCIRRDAPVRVAGNNTAERTDVQGVTPNSNLKERIAHLLELGCAHAGREDLIEAFALLLPTYEPFVLDGTGVFAGGGNEMGTGEYEVAARGSVTGAADVGAVPAQRPPEIIRAENVPAG